MYIIKEITTKTNSKKAIIGLEGFDLKIVGHKEFKHD